MTSQLRLAGHILPNDLLSNEPLTRAVIAVDPAQSDSRTGSKTCSKDGPQSCAKQAPVPVQCRPDPNCPSVSLLQGLQKPTDLVSLKEEELAELAGEVRELIINTVSKNGGHLAPSLGVVELTMALLKSFDFSQDRLIWDVGHQSYAYKILTGRAESFGSIRKFKGLSGFPKPDESPYDHFGVGHSSTSISAALGFAMARDLAGQDHHVVSVIGDGALTAGLAFEGLNQAGHMGKRMIVVLNDNEMSISKNVGALSLFLSRGLSTAWVRRVKEDIRLALGAIPGIGEELVNFAIRSQHGLKSVFTPGMLFEALNFKYVGPVDGHNLKALCEVLEVVKGVKQPVLLHVLTKKGKGYTPAEANPVHFHGVGKFKREEKKDEVLPEALLSEIEVQTAPASPTEVAIPSYTQVFTDTLHKMAAQDKRIVAITAAMPEGTGLSRFAEAFPDRFVDVGICEQHAVTFAAGLALQGLKPVVAVYSTFLQRSYDQIVHDVCIQNLPVTFCLDRAGLVGEDGPTHHGVFDLSYLRHIPNLTILAPKDEAELQEAMTFALQHEGPVALRYPRGKGVGVALHQDPPLLPFAVEELLKADNASPSPDVAEGSGKPTLAILAIGNMVHPALEAAKIVSAQTGQTPGVYNVRWVKPLPKEDLLAIARRHDKLLLLEENTLAGGFSSAILELLADNDCLAGKQVRRIGVNDEFVEHGSVNQLRAMLKMDQAGIVEAISKMLSPQEINKGQSALLDCKLT